MDTDEPVTTMTMTMKTTTNINPRSLRNQTATCDEQQQQPMTSTTDCRSWKLYDNPIFQFHPNPFPQHSPFLSPATKTHLRRVSPKKIGPFSSNLASELDLAKTHIAELKSELETERARRKKAESALAGKIESDRRRTDTDKIKINQAKTVSPSPEKLMSRRVSAPARLVLGEKWVSPAVSPAGLRRVLPEIENPHIRRGIRGFVEFPRVIRAVGSKSMNWGSKLECQKAQLRILLKQKGSINGGSSINSNLIIS